MIRGIHGPGRISPAALREAHRSAHTATGSLFDATLREALNRPQEITFSGHAQARLAQSHIVLNRNDLQAIGEAVDRASSAGARESLVFMNDMAFVVSVPNRTVITVVDRARMQNNVFTNIDSAVIVPDEPGS